MGVGIGRPTAIAREGQRLEAFLAGGVHSRGSWCSSRFITLLGADELVRVVHWLAKHICLMFATSAEEVYHPTNRTRGARVMLGVAIIGLPVIYLEGM